MKKLTFFSIIIPVYNKLPHLERSVDSVLNQTYQNFELIIVDDASTDGSYKKLQSFNNEKINLLRRITPGAGGYAARNVGIRKARFEWILFLDADDEWDLELLKELNDRILQEPSLEIVSWGCYVINGSRKVLDSYSKKYHGLESKEISLIDYLKYPRPINTITVAIRKDILLKTGGFPEGQCKRGGDVDTYIRCLEVSNKSLWINKPYAKYYTDSVNMVTSQDNDEIPFSFNSTKRILGQTRNSKLKSAIMVYHNSKIYGVALRKIRRNNDIDFNLLKELHLVKIDGYLVLAKIIYHYLKKNFVFSR